MRSNKSSIIVVVFLALMLIFSGSILSTQTVEAAPNVAAAIEVLPTPEEPSYNILDDLEIGKRTTDKTDENSICVEFGLGNGGTRSLFTSPIKWLMCGVAKFFDNNILQPFYAFACKFQVGGVGQAYDTDLKGVYDKDTRECTVN